jgi:uncharacterized protein YacL
MKKIKEKIKNKISTDESINYASRMTCLMSGLASYIIAFIIMIYLPFVIIKNYNTISEHYLRGVIGVIITFIITLIFILLGKWLHNMYQKIKSYSKEK